MRTDIYLYMASNLKKRGADHSPRSQTNRRTVRERVLLEFPSALLKRADKAAEGMNASRSDLIRTAVEQLLDRRDRERLEAELAEAYTANAAMNLELAQEFKHVDEEGF